MSRIGRLPVTVPKGVEVAVDGTHVAVKGPKGTLEHTFPADMTITLEDGVVKVARPSDERGHRALHGMTRALINNMVRGVSEGFVKKLEIHGVGFKAAVQGQTVTLTLGYSHPIVYALPDQIKVTVADNTKLTVEGPDRQAVGEVAAELRSFYPPEPYKGKGVRYSDERVIRKEGKTVQ